MKKIIFCLLCTAYALSLHSQDSSDNQEAFYEMEFNGEGPVLPAEISHFLDSLILIEKWWEINCKGMCIEVYSDTWVQFTEKNNDLLEERIAMAFKSESGSWILVMGNLCRGCGEKPSFASDSLAVMEPLKADEWLPLAQRIYAKIRTCPRGVGIIATEVNDTLRRRGY